MTGAPHIPVLLDEVVEALDPRPGDVVIDATFGAGGYTRALLERGAIVHAFDRDPDAIAAGRTWRETGENPPRLILHPHRFSEMLDVMTSAGVARVDGVVMDIGVSSMQLDQAHRGFAFSADGPLDMRMSQDGESAADFLNSADEKAIADILYTYGEERQSRRVARAIVAARPLETTGDLARVVRKALGHKPHDKKDPATRSFQAVRIHVNGELDELEQGLFAAETLLGEGGRLAVVSFHSLEDRIVKNFIRKQASDCICPPGTPVCVCDHLATVKIITRRPIVPTDAEIETNSRARSAKLRVAERI